MAGRKYCRNTVPGRQGRGKKYPAAVRAEVVMAMIGSNSICAVARKYGVPESTIRSWMAEEAGKPDSVFAKARAEAAREIAARAALGAKAQIGYLQQRVAENQRAAEVRAKLHQRLDEDVRARDFALGSRLKSEDEVLADATETGGGAADGSGKRGGAGAGHGPGQRPERADCTDGAAERGRKAGGGTGWQRDGIRAGASCGSRSRNRLPLCGGARTRRYTAEPLAAARATHW